MENSSYICQINDKDMENKITADVKEAAKAYAIHNSLIGYESVPYKSFLAGAEWQAERMYTETEVLSLLEKCCKWQLPQTEEDTLAIRKWFENNKKK